MPMVQNLMNAANVSFGEIGMIAVSVGPGSFTGVRTGLAAAKGFAQALNIPIVGISTLEAIAVEAQKMAAKSPLRVVIDAKRGEVHTQDFAANGSADSVPVILSLADAKEGRGLRLLAGNGSGLVDSETPGILPGASTASIMTFAEIAAAKLLNDKTSLTTLPLYLRGADAKPQTGFALERTFD